MVCKKVWWSSRDLVEAELFGRTLLARLPIYLAQRAPPRMRHHQGR